MQHRLTGPADWEWSGARPHSLQRVRAAANDPTQFYSLFRSFLPPGPGTFLELGGAPGTISARLVVDTELVPYAVDFSRNARAYTATMAAIGKDATIFQQDVFEFEAPHTFDVVSSFGLIEHFVGDDLERLLRIHDEVTAPGGLVFIEMPNFRGAQRLWHTLADKRNLDLHNLEAMRLQTFSIFDDLGYTTLYKGYFGRFRVWTELRHVRGGVTRRAIPLATRAANKAAREARRLGIRLEGPRWSPYLLYVGRKPKEQVVQTSRPGLPGAKSPDDSP